MSKRVASDVPVLKVGCGNGKSLHPSREAWLRFILEGNETAESVWDAESVVKHRRAFIALSAANPNHLDLGIPLSVANKSCTWKLGTAAVASGLDTSHTGGAR
ncbi:hypothetical protein VTK73DRAFT_744 [Phialemonium thermophilum]|uniref:Uncharacterized protein n=1 Tax=Phialemonium thermophilum TaxID=223376 RepID=A0ABR3VUE9_9PEZI